MKQTLRKIAHFLYMFSVSLTGIVKSPLFKRWLTVCINKLLVCFSILNFVIWCIFLFPLFAFCIKVAGAQTCSSQGKSPVPGLSDSPVIIAETYFSAWKSGKVGGCCTHENCFSKYLLFSSEGLSHHYWIQHSRSRSCLWWWRNEARKNVLRKLMATEILNREHRNSVPIKDKNK